VNKTKWYESNIRKLLLEFNVLDQPPYLTDLNAEELADQIETANINFVYVHAKDNGGTLFYDSKVGKQQFAVKGRDFIQEFITALKKRGIRVGLHVNVSKDKRMYNLRPDWRQKWQNGKDREYPGDYPQNPDWDEMCHNSPYRQYVLEIFKELTARYDFDGYWIDRFDWGGKLPERFSCGCNYCRKMFYEDTGYRFPEEVNWNDPAWLSFVRWRSRSITIYLNEVVHVIKSIKPNVSVCLNAHVGLDLFTAWFHGQDAEDCFSQVDLMTQEIHYDREGWLSYTLYPKFLRAIGQGKPFDIITYRHSGAIDYGFRSTLQLKTECLAIISNGGATMIEDFIYPDGTIESETYKRISEAYKEIKKREEYIIPKSKPVPFAGVLYSKNSRLYFGRNDPDKYLHNFLGTSKALTEEHIPFEIITDNYLYDINKLRNFEVIVLPNTACLALEQVKVVRQYVEEGGGLVATYLTSQRNWIGKELNNFALADVFGVDFIGNITENLSYIKLIDNDVINNIPVNVPLQHNGKQLKVKVNSGESLGCIVKGLQGLNRLVYPFDPPSKINSMYPFAVKNEFGKGRVIYFSGQPGAVYGQQGLQEFRKILTKSIVWAGGGENNLPFIIKGPSSLETTLFKQEGQSRYVLHLLNYQPDIGRSYDYVESNFIT